MNFFLITGPPAVGKMTVGQELAKRMEYKLFHNHDSIEFALKFFWFGSDEFGKINEGIRQLIFETVSQSKLLKGFIFTLVWAFDQQDDWDYVADLKSRFLEKDWNFFIVELFAPIEIRLKRNLTPHRLSQKKSKQNTEKSQDNLIAMESKYQMTS